jgi:hypothetical protein
MLMHGVSTIQYRQVGEASVSHTSISIDAKWSACWLQMIRLPHTPSARAEGIGSKVHDAEQQGSSFVDDGWASSSHLSASTSWNPTMVDRR